MSAIPWSAEEKATLYGWLDYGVKVLGYSKEDFFSTVGIKLEDSGSTRHDVNKITSKLKRDWFRYGSTGYDFDDIFKDGASDLFGFSIEEKEQISAVKQQFVQESTNTTPARRLRRDRTSNQLRSMSRTPAQFSKNESPSLIKKESRIHGSPALKTYGKYRKRGRVQAPRDLETAMKQNKKSKHKVYSIPANNSDARANSCYRNHWGQILDPSSILPNHQTKSYQTQRKFTHMPYQSLRTVRTGETN